MAKNDMIYIRTFSNHNTAKLVMSMMHEIASDYGWATMSDLKNLSGFTATFEDTTKGWSLGALDNVVITEYKDGYKLFMPQFDRFETAMNDCACDECDEYDYSGEPVNLNIPFECYLKHPEVIDHALQALFKVPEKIEGRPIFINII